MKKVGICLLALSVLLTVLAGCGVSFAPLSGTMLQYENADAYRSGGASVSGDISNLEIHWIDGNVKIAYHDGEEIVFSEASSASLSSSDLLHYLVSDDTLTVQYGESGVMMDVALKKDLTILIPRKQKNGESTLLHSLDIKTVNADVWVDEVEVTKCELENISGKFTANFGRELYELSFETVSGKAEITANYIEEAEIESVNGDVVLRIGTENSHTPIRSLDVQTVSGDLFLVLPKEVSFTLTHESVSGKLETDFEWNRIGKTYVVGNGETDIHVESVSGSTKIQKFN